MTATFYDRRLRAVVAAEDRYRPLYEAALRLIPTTSSVVELGSGSGRFAKMLLERGNPYQGIDFAPSTVAEATRHAGPVFRVDDLRTCEIPPADVYVALEVLEHLDDDLGLIRRLPQGSQLILSVPSFDSASHVRHFPEYESAATRYGAVLLVIHASYVHLPNGAYFHLLGGVVR